MNAAVRPYATAGVALLGASVIAISPLAPPMPDIHAMQRTVSSVGIELSAAVNPIENWIQVFQASAANLGAIGQQVVDSPAPILKQIVVNQIAAFKDLQTRLEGTAGVVKGIFDGAPNTIATAWGELQSGDIVAAFNTFNDQIVIPLALAGVQVVSDLTRPLVSTVNNFAKAFATLPDAVFQVILPLTYPLVSTVNVVVQATQDMYDGVVGSDLGAVINTLVNLPANLVDGFLNGAGTTLGFINTPGLLSPYDPNLGFLASGPISSLIALRDVIAQAIGAPVPNPTAATSAAATVPSAAKTVTLSTALEVSRASAAKGATKAAPATAAESTPADTTGAAPVAEATTTESATDSSDSTTASTKAAPAADSATGGSDASSSDTKAGSSATRGNDSKAGAGKKASAGKSARSARAGK